jgi:hypothetical protein
MDSLHSQVQLLTAELKDLKEDYATNQWHNLEVDTADKVDGRVFGWFKRITIWVSICCGILLLTLSIIFGKAYKGFYDLIVDGKASLNNRLEQSKTAYLTFSQNIDYKQKQVEALNTSLQTSTNNFNQAKADLTNIQAEVPQLAASVASLKKDIGNTQEQVHAITMSRLEHETELGNPEFGDHSITDLSGHLVSIQNKSAGATYVAFAVYTQNKAKPRFKCTQILEAREGLEKHGFQTFYGQVVLWAGTQVHGVVAGFNSGSCQQFLPFEQRNMSNAPCILYFHEAVRGKAMEAKRLLASTEDVADNQVHYVPVTVLG